MVPLLESAESLTGSGSLLTGILAEPRYRAHLASRGGRQEVMLGYSDSNKESGYLAAHWLLYRAQEQLVAAATDAGVELTIFHGRGGALGRGGGPTHRAVLAAPPASSAGRLKLTEQGEVIATRYANPSLASWDLERTVSATILASTAEHDRAVGAAAIDGTEAMDELASTARAAYRALVWDDPDLESVFLRATPIAQIAGLRLGSRPVARGRRTGTAATDRTIDGLRAIPWVFAWTQVRANLPAWYGLGAAVDAYVARHGAAGLAQLERLYAGWPFFRVLLENAEVAMARTDPGITARHLALAGPAGERIAAAIASEHARSTRGVLAVTGRAALLDGVPAMQRSIERRTPYLDPLSELQIEAGRRLLASVPGSPDYDRLERLVGLTISGIAAGVQGTG